MKWSFAGVGLIMIGLFGIIIIMLFNEITVSNEQDYYTLKDAAEAAMIESIDVTYYRLTGEIKMVQEKFVENFVRRFAESVSLNNTYTVEFYDIYEAPPKVSVRVSSDTNTFNIFGDSTSFDVVEKVDAILEVGTQG